MRIVIKKGKDGRYRAMMTGGRADGPAFPLTSYIPTHSFATPGEAAAYANMVVSAISRSGAEIVTEDGDAWYFGEEG